MRIIFANIDEKPINKFDDKVKYVFITDNKNSINKYTDIKIKPIVIMYNGSYVVDLENNSVIINKPIDENSCNKIIEYGNSHKVILNKEHIDKNVFLIKITTDNYHRRLIIPYMFKDLFPDVGCITRNKSIYVYSKKASLINAIDEVLNYLNVTNNYVDLENIYTNVSSETFNRDNVNWKGIDICEN